MKKIPPLVNQVPPEKWSTKLVITTWEMFRLTRLQSLKQTHLVNFRLWLLMKKLIKKYKVTVPISTSTIIGFNIDVFKNMVKLFES